MYHFKGEFYKGFKQQKITFSHKLFQRIDEANKIPNSFLMPASFDIKTGQGNYEKRKLQANLAQNTDVKLMGKIFENRTSQCYKAIRAPQSKGLIYPGTGAEAQQSSRWGRSASTWDRGRENRIAPEKMSIGYE